MKDVRIRAITRESSREKGLPVHEVSQVEWTNLSQLRSAIVGVDAAYFMLPTGLHNGSLYEFRNAYSRAFIEVANELGLKRIVHLSSFGAHLSERSGVLKGLYRAERNLEDFKGELAIIRPGYFWQNFLGNIDGHQRRTVFSADIRWIRMFVCFLPILRTLGRWRRSF